MATRSNRIIDGFDDWDFLDNSVSSNRNSSDDDSIEVLERETETTDAGNKRSDYEGESGDGQNSTKNDESSKNEADGDADSQETKSLQDDSVDLKLKLLFALCLLVSGSGNMMLCFMTLTQNGLLESYMGNSFQHLQKGLGYYNCDTIAVEQVDDLLKLQFCEIEKTRLTYLAVIQAASNKDGDTYISLTKMKRLLSSGQYVTSHNKQFMQWLNTMISTKPAETCGESGVCLDDGELVVKLKGTQGVTNLLMRLIGFGSDEGQRLRSIDMQFSNDTFPDSFVPFVQDDDHVSKGYKYEDYLPESEYEAKFEAKHDKEGLDIRRSYQLYDKMKFIDRMLQTRVPIYAFQDLRMYGDNGRLVRDHFDKQAKMIIPLAAPDTRSVILVGGRGKDNVTVVTIERETIPVDQLDGVVRDLSRVQLNADPTVDLTPQQKQQALRDAPVTEFTVIHYERATPVDGIRQFDSIPTACRGNVCYMKENEMQAVMTRVREVLDIEPDETLVREQKPTVFVKYRTSNGRQKYETFAEPEEESISVARQQPRFEAETKSNARERTTTFYKWDGKVNGFVEHSVRTRWPDDENEDELLKPVEVPANPTDELKFAEVPLEPAAQDPEPSVENVSNDKLDSVLDNFLTELRDAGKNELGRGMDAEKSDQLLKENPNLCLGVGVLKLLAERTVDESTADWVKKISNYVAQSQGTCEAPKGDDIRHSHEELKEDGRKKQDQKREKEEGKKKHEEKKEESRKMMEERKRAALKEEGRKQRAEKEELKKKWQKGEDKGSAEKSQEEEAKKGEKKGRRRLSKFYKKFKENAKKFYDKIIVKNLKEWF